MLAWATAKYLEAHGLITDNEFFAVGKLHSAVLMAYTALNAVKVGSVVKMLRPTDN